MIGVGSSSAPGAEPGSLGTSYCSLLAQALPGRNPPTERPNAQKRMRLNRFMSRNLLPVHHTRPQLAKRKRGPRRQSRVAPEPLRRHSNFVHGCRLRVKRIHETCTATEHWNAVARTSHNGGPRRGWVSRPRAEFAEI